MLNETDPTLVSWIANCEALIASQHRRDYPNSTTITKLVLEVGSKFIRVVKDDGTQRSAWAFVAREDGQTKTLGSWLKGDVLKPASWKIPAKHARGNIFTSPTGGVTYWTGPSYLK